MGHILDVSSEISDEFLMTAALSVPGALGLGDGEVYALVAMYCAFPM